MSQPAVAARRPRIAVGRSVGELAAWLGAVIADVGPGERTLGGVTHDSRLVRPGDLYAALPGARAHGATFAAEAAKAGAVACLTDRAGAGHVSGTGMAAVVVDDPRLVLGPVASWIYAEPSTKLQVLGVTGTNGKTTTAYLIEAGLRAAAETTGLIGTIETRIGDQVVPSVRTTPEASDLQTLFALMVEHEVGAVAMEVSSHALALHRVDGTAFDVVGFTNLSQDHLDFHADLDDYFAAKARLFTPEFAPRGVVNNDDEHGRRLLADPKIELVSYSADGRDADWRASHVVVAPQGSRFVARGPGVEVELTTTLPGHFNVANCLGALAMLVSAGIPAEAAAAGIAGLRGVPGRLEPIVAGQPFAVFVDYAHTPQAVTTLLETLRTTLRETTAGRLLIVLGCGGDRDVAKRPLMGAAAARLADVAVFTSDNPRSEDPEQILAALVAGAEQVLATERAEVHVEVWRHIAIAEALRVARPGDVVVVAGKGHEQGQEIAGVLHPFDDRSVVREQLRLLGFSAVPGEFGAAS
ncbi:MAG: UDP-N-acetylmuramoyl-L-alanyl-D-glutamate--2,6-diaminopimelate ligase [Acidothermaceae bacterium]